ncbi:PAS domain-containing sensor histidine kinase [Echinicola strongylocentroti]|uniref:histidine kinase n=1 Tax=Echinicola strongylocentroti TaxID=1795355 RepID=A0A2Z4INC1_9BACT|nr:histidine kinase N-terminal 7TM domain-containing protein [Echinicola strongylocentroti]AWW32334.1 PAS domain-containing sensor histidine kinase [Echinicola strongylocentroti]
MEFTLSAYSLSLLIFAVLILLFAVFLFARLSKDVRWFGAMMVAVSIWAASDGIMVGMDQLETMLFVVNFEYVGIALVPVFWLLFVLKFVGKEAWLNRKQIACQFIFPLLSIIMVWTNGLHHLHYQKAVVKEMDGLYGLLTSKGPWYIIHTSYFYLAIGFGVYLLVKRLLSTEGVYKKQTFIILLGTLVPWIANILVVFQVGPFNGIDPTPHAFMITCMIVFFGFFELGLFDVKPIARNLVVDSMKNGMLVIDDALRVVDVNPCFTKLINKSTGAITGKHVDDLGFDKSEWGELLQSQDEIIREKVITVNGSPRYFEISSKFLKEGNKRYQGRLLLFRDITQYIQDQRVLEHQARELTELNATKDRLLSIISHDLRNPLNSLTQFLDMVESGWITEEEFKEMLPAFAKNLKHVSGFMENLLEWAYTQIKGEAIKVEAIDIEGEIEEIISLYKGNIDEKSVRIIVSNECSNQAYGDLNMIRLVLRNLISNAIKFCDRADEIRLAVISRGEFIEVSVEDTGIGIDQQNIEKIFSSTPFTTIGTHNEKGTGLGLMLSKDFVEKNGGKIWVESELGIGTKFCFTIPSVLKEPQIASSKSLP